MSYKTQVYRFWTDYRPDPEDAGNMIGVDYVEYGPIGLGERVRCIESIRRLSAVRPRDANSMNKTLEEANDKWDFIRPLYEAWKGGQDVPENGTPLAAWNALTPEQAEILRMRSIRTVEEIAEMQDSGITRIPLPGMRKLVDAAKLFLAAQDQSRVASDLARKDAEIAALKAQMDELIEMVKVDDQTGEIVPKKRGRPKKEASA